MHTQNVLLSKLAQRRGRKAVGLRAADKWLMTARLHRIYPAVLAVLFCLSLKIKIDSVNEVARQLAAIVQRESVSISRRRREHDGRENH